MNLQEQVRRLVLASASPTRQEVLKNAGLSFEVFPADLDEDAVKKKMRSDGFTAQDTAQRLSDLKAQAVSEQRQEAFVIGADQMLESDGRWFDKPSNMLDARDQLMHLKGVKHRLFSSVSVALNGQLLFRHGECSFMTMRNFSDQFVASYLEIEKDDVCQSVGGYKLEGRGIQLFSSVEGGYFDILGLPLLPLLAFLRTKEMVGD
tara:strand:- start:1061 stop:1675 length:615 start_codon:yes stop_codon:yes gene_type:complete